MLRAFPQRRQVQESLHAGRWGTPRRSGRVLAGVGGTSLVEDRCYPVGLLKRGTALYKALLLSTTSRAYHDMVGVARLIAQGQLDRVGRRLARRARSAARPERR